MLYWYHWQTMNCLSVSPHLKSFHCVGKQLLSGHFSYARRMTIHLSSHSSGGVPCVTYWKSKNTYCITKHVSCEAVSRFFSLATHCIICPTSFMFFLISFPFKRHKGSWKSIYIYFADLAFFSLPLGGFILKTPLHILLIQKSHKAKYSSKKNWWLWAQLTVNFSALPARLSPSYKVKHLSVPLFVYSDNQKKPNQKP